jgi:hypothetical protein
MKKIILIYIITLSLWMLSFVFISIDNYTTVKYEVEDSISNDAIMLKIYNICDVYFVMSIILLSISIFFCILTIYNLKKK